MDRVHWGCPGAHALGGPLHSGSLSLSGPQFPSLKMGPGFCRGRPLSLCLPPPPPPGDGSFATLQGPCSANPPASLRLGFPSRLPNPRIVGGRFYIHLEAFHNRFTGPQNGPRWVISFSLIENSLPTPSAPLGRAQAEGWGQGAPTAVWAPRGPPPVLKWGLPGIHLDGGCQYCCHPRPGGAEPGFKPVLSQPHVHCYHG